VAAAVVPTQHGRSEFGGSVVQETLGLQVVLDLQEQLVFVVIAGGLAGGEKVRRWQLHLVADDDHLGRTVDGRYGFLDRDLASFLEDHDIEPLLVNRHRLGDRERAREPDGLEVVDDGARVALAQVTNGAVAHDLLELALEDTATGVVDALGLLLFGRELRGWQRADGQT